MIARRTLFYWHRGVGLAIVLLAVLSALTGTTLLFRESLREPTPRAPAVKRSIALDAIVARGVAAGDGSPATDLTLPLAAGDPYRVYLDDDDETVVFLDGSGAVLERRATATSLTRLLFRVHTGDILGPPGTVVTAITGAGLVLLGLSGVGMVVARRRRRSRRLTSAGGGG